MMETAQWYARELKFRVLPLHWISGGACSCKNPDCPSPGKHPLTPTGVKEATTNEEQIRQWWGQWPEANIGIASGKYSGIVVLDIDNKQGGLEKLDQLRDQFPEINNSLQVSTGGGGFHFYFKYPDDYQLGCRNKIDGYGVDVRGDGGYVVAPPSGHISESGYDWLDVGDDPNRNDLIEPSSGLIEYMGPKSGSLEKMESNIEGSVYVDNNLLAKIRSALHYVRPYGDDWLHCGMAIHYATGGHIKGFEIWDEWAKSAPEYAHIDPKLHLKRYLTFETNRSDHITDATLWSKARKNNWIWVDRETTFVDDLSVKKPGSIDLPFIQVGPYKVPLIPYDDLPAVYSFSELKELSANENFETFWRDHVLFRGGIMLIAGAPKSGKSALFLQLAKAAAVGGEFLGHKFERPIKVLWLQAEINRHYICDRVGVVSRDLPMEQKALFDKNFRTTGKVELSITNDKDYQIIASMIASFEPDLVCIDPLINFSDANENDNTEVRQLMRRVSSLSQVIPEESAVVFIHHTSKQNSKHSVKDPFDLIRGAGAIRGAYDTGIVLIKEPRSERTKLFYETRNGKEPIEHGIERDDKGLFQRVDLDVQKQENGQFTALPSDTTMPVNITDDRMNQILNKIQASGEMSKVQLEDMMITFGLSKTSSGAYVKRLKLHADSHKDPLITYNKNAKNKGERIIFRLVCSDIPNQEKSNFRVSN